MATMAGARQRNFSTRPEKQEENLLVFGYSCKIFRDDEKANFIDHGKHLIPWMGDENVMIDRYDVRGYLHDLKPYEAKPDSCYGDDLTDEEKQMERLCDEERYLALRKDLTEEQMYQEEELKRLRAAVAGDGAYHEIGFTYDDTDNLGNESQYPSAIKAEELDDEPYKVPDDLHVPKGMQVPSNMKIHAIIEKTATFVSQQGGQMEIIIKMKQSSNPQFAFMHLDNPLYPYYKHLVKEIKTGKYKPPETKKPVRETDDEDEDGHYLHPSLMSGKPDLIPKFTVPSISFRRTNDDSYAILVKNLRQRIIDDAQSSSPGSQPGQDNSNAGSPLTVDDNSNQQHPSDSETEGNKTEQPPPPGEEKLTGDEDGRSMSSSSSDVSDSPLTDSSDDEKEVKPSLEVIPPPPNIKPIIDKMAEYVAKNGEDFEYVVKSKKDRRFDFLHPWHEYHQYYLMKRNEALERQKPPPVKSDSETQSDADAETRSEPETNQQTKQDVEDCDQNHLSSLPVDPKDSAMPSGNETEAACDENGVSSCGEENVVNCGSDSIVTFASDDPKISEVPCDEKMEEGGEALVSSAIEMQAAIEEENPPKDEKLQKSIIKVVKGPISFSLKSKDGDCGSIDRAKKRTLLLDDSDGEEEEGVDNKKLKVDSNIKKKAKEDQYPAVGIKDVNNLTGEDKVKKLSAEELEAKHAEERIKDKLAAAARERLAQQKREKQLQLERKRRAALFLNMLKSNSVSKVSENAEDLTTGSDVVKKLGVESRLNPLAESSPKEENGEVCISPSISEITSPRNGTITTLSRNHSPSVPPVTVNSVAQNDKWSSSSSSSSSSSDESSCEKCSHSQSKDLSPPGAKQRKLKHRVESKIKKKKKKKHSHSSKSETHKDRRKQHSKSRARSRSRGRHKSHKLSKSRSDKHKRSRSRSRSKRTKTLPAAYNVSKKSRSRSRSPRHHRPSSRFSPSHRTRRKL